MSARSKSDQRASLALGLESSTPMNLSCVDIARRGILVSRRMHCRCLLTRTRNKRDSNIDLGKDSKAARRDLSPRPGVVGLRCQNSMKAIFDFPRTDTGPLLLLPSTSPGLLLELSYVCSSSDKWLEPV